MSFFQQIASLVKDPPPSYVFEFSDAGIAFASQGQTGFQPLPAGTLRGSPSEDNLLKLDVITSAIRRIAPPNAGKKRKPVAVLLPDQTARVSVLDFDSFPSNPEEQFSLVKFRVKKTLPFDIESAAVSYYVQGGKNKSGKIEVVAVSVALEVLARYEAMFRAGGLHPGDVTVSALSALSLCSGHEISVVAKLAGKSLTVMVVGAGRLKLFRCLELEEASEEEILSVLYPTIAYAEDELGATPQKLILCGFPQVPTGLPCQIEPLHSRFGLPGPYNSGLLGYLEEAGA